MKEEMKAQVKQFWNRNVCHVSFVEDKDVGSLSFFEEADTLRYKYHYYLLPLFVKLESRFPQGELLEIGCGMGTDLCQLANRGFHVTGVDLTENAIELAIQRFELYGISGRLIVGDAENLDFGSNSFDVVYSFGVLHHTPDTPRSIEEIRRVLKPDGLAIVMLYNRHSLNYLAHWITGIPFDGSKRDPCPVERAYTKQEVRELFKNFSSVDISIEYLFGTGWGVVNRFVPKFIHRSLGRIWGWHNLILAAK